MSWCVTYAAPYQGPVNIWKVQQLHSSHPTCTQFYDFVLFWKHHSYSYVHRNTAPVSKPTLGMHIKCIVLQGKEATMVIVWRHCNASKYSTTCVISFSRNSGTMAGVVFPLAIILPLHSSSTEKCVNQLSWGKSWGCDQTEPGSSGGNTLFIPQISASIPRPVFNRTDICADTMITLTLRDELKDTPWSLYTIVYMQLKSYIHSNIVFTYHIIIISENWQK